MGKDKCVEWDTPPRVYCKYVRLNSGIQIENKEKEDAVLSVQAAMGMTEKQVSIMAHCSWVVMIQSFIKRNNSETRTEVP